MNRNIKDLGNAIWKKKMYILLITMIFAITGVCYTLANVKYVASQKILVSAENSNLVDTYKELIKGSTVLEKVIGNLGVDLTVQELADFIEVETVANTDMLEIKVVGEEEEQIESISSEIANVFIQTASEIYENPQLYKVDESSSYCNSGSVILAGIGTLIVGFVLSSLFFAVSFLLDTKIKSCKDIENITDLKSLISIPNSKIIAKKKLNMKNVRAHKSEVFKTLMTNIQFVNMNNLENKSILITSPNPLDGKTYVATNLAIEFAKVGKKVILIDSDMRHGKLAKVFNLPNDLGFSNYLSNLDANGTHINERITRFINDTEIKNLNVITAGNIPPNPIELLKTNKVKELMKDLKVFYDVIIFDTVAVLEAPEVSMLSKVCDLSLIISAYGKTKKNDLAIAYEELNAIDGSNIGMGLNKIPDRKVKRKMYHFNNQAKQVIGSIEKNVKIFGTKLKGIRKVFRKVFAKMFSKIMGVLKMIAGIMMLGFLSIRKATGKFVDVIKSKSQKVKEYIEKYKNRREKIKLIEAGSMIVENDESNIIKEVFESEMAKLETADEIEYRKKLDDLKMNLDEKVSIQAEQVSSEKARPVVRQTNSAVKTKFDLMREQQEKNELNLKEEKVEEIKKDAIKSEKDLGKHQQLEIQEVEEIKKKEESQEVKKEKPKKETIVYEEIDFQNPENLTEEMIRKQVEMDEMIRISEMEEEEEKQRQRQMKQKERTQKRQIRKERWIKFKEEKLEQFQNVMNSMKSVKEENDLKNIQKREIIEEERLRKSEAKIEQKIQKEKERNENKEKIAKQREEKRAFREMEKQRQRDEARIMEELQEDNLYPKIRM